MFQHFIKYIFNIFANIQRLFHKSSNSKEQARLIGVNIKNDKMIFTCDVAGYTNPINIDSSELIDERNLFEMFSSDQKKTIFRAAFQKSTTMRIKSIISASDYCTSSVIILEDLNTGETIPFDSAERIILNNNIINRLSPSDAAKIGEIYGSEHK